MATVSELLQSCLAQFISTASLSSLSAHAAEVDPQAWKDELGRLRSWTAKVGAHQAGQSSLDYRLRDASHIKDEVTRLLEQVRKLLTDLEVTLEEGEHDESPHDGSDPEDNFGSGIQQIHHGLVATITQLHQVSAQHERLTGTDRLDGDELKVLGEQHPSAEKPADWKDQEEKVEEEKRKQKKLDMNTALEEWKLERSRLKQKQKEETKKKDEEFRQRLRLEFGYSEEIEAIEKILHMEEEGQNEEETSEDGLTITWIKVSREHLFPETLISYDLPWRWDEDDNDCIVIKQWISWKLQDELFAHSRGLREGKLLAQAEIKVDDQNKDMESPGGRFGKIWSNLRKHYAGSV